MIIMESYNKNQGRARGVINKNILQTIKTQEMDRKDFLRYCGFVLLGLVGLKTFISLLSQTGTELSDSTKKSTHDFGGGKYGV